MLPAWIIDWFKKKEQVEKPEERPQLEIPKPVVDVPKK